MRNKEVKENISAMRVLRGLTRAYSQISSTRMQATRRMVLTNREFTEGVDSVFRQTLYSYQKELVKKRKKEGGAFTFLSHNGRTVAVLLSANTGLYGDIVRRTFDLFARDIRNSDIEVTIIGRLGKAFFLDTFYGRPYTYFDIPDWGVHTDKLVDIVKHLVQYKDVNIYYGRFENIVKQVPQKLYIAREIELSAGEEEEVVRYIFEPSIESVLGFFEGEIFASTLYQTVQESQLAKLASRAFSMDKADQSISKAIEASRLESLRQIHHQRSRKQIGAMGSVFGR